MGDKSSGEGGPPPPSPLTGAYLLIVLPQTHLPQHKDYVLHNLTKGLITWDKDACHVDLEKELQTITSQAPEGEEAKNGERLIQFASENLVTEVLIHPQLNTLVQCMRNLLSSFTRHRHIVHAGYACAGNGAWMVQDGTYSFADFADMYQEMEVQRVLRAYENTVTVDIHCCQEGDWNNLKPSSKDIFSKISTVRLNPNDKMSSVKAIHDFLDYLSPYIASASLEELLESSDVVGNIRFSHPTLYVFPGGQGDAALFGINGFNMLVDGGFSRKACFWDFTRHLDRLDAVLMTRVNNGNVQGLASLLQRKKTEHVYPQIGHFFCNMQERRQPLSPDGDKDRDPLLINLIDLGQEMLVNLRHLQLKPQLCIRDSSMDPINLYHKVGHGKLDMYVLSPSKESRELKDFLAKWNAVDSKIFCSYNKKGGEFTFPLCNRASICALLVWQPANPEDNITRLLFPGSTPQQKIFEGLDRLRNLEFMKHPVCSAKSLSPSASSVGLNIRTVGRTKVPAIIDKIPENEIKQGKTSEAVKPAVKVSTTTGITDKVQKQVSAKPTKPKTEKLKEKPKTDVETKIETVKQDKIKQSETVQKEKQKDKPKRATQKQAEKKIQKTPSGDKKSDSIKSSPTTPKKIAENKLIETAAKAEPKPRASTRTKPSPSATPAKSAKEANNRKVMEQKTKEISKSQKIVAKKDEKKVDKVHPVKKSVPSPSKTAKTTSPIKTAKASVRQKQDVKKAMKADKDLPTDSSAVSTPSTVDADLTGMKVKDDMVEKEGIPATDSRSDDAKDVAEEKPTTLSKEEEDEILIIEKIEIDGAEAGKGDVESIAMHIQKGEQKEEVKEKEMVEKVEEEAKEKSEKLKGPEAEEILSDAEKKEEIVPETQQEAEPPAKVKLDVQKPESQETSVAREIPSTDRIITPKEKDVKEKPGEMIEQKQADESQPDEKFSTTVESGATTTAPTLPEDERIPLDEIKEGIEEKYIKEETKEKDIGLIQRPEQPTSLPEVPKISGTLFDQRAQLLKDIVKTPDEVADLPVHEEADAGIYVGADVAGKEIQKSKEDLLTIPAGKKPIEKKDTEAAEELKFIKDGLEKEDKSKDLKEDLISSDQISATIPTDISSGERLETKDESEEKMQELLLEKEDELPPERPETSREEIEKESEGELEDKLIDEGIEEAEEIQKEEQDLQVETKKATLLEQEVKDKDLGIIADETEQELAETVPTTIDTEKEKVQEEKPLKEVEILEEEKAVEEVLEITKEKLPSEMIEIEQTLQTAAAIKAKRDSLDEALILDKDDEIETEEIEEKIVSDTMEKETPPLQKIAKDGKPAGEIDVLEEKEIDEAEEQLGVVPVEKAVPAEDAMAKDLEKSESTKHDEVSKDIEKFEEEEIKEIEIKPIKEIVKAEKVEQGTVLEEAVELKEELVIVASKKPEALKEKTVEIDEKKIDVQTEKKAAEVPSKDLIEQVTVEKEQIKQEMEVKQKIEDLQTEEVKEKEDVKLKEEMKKITEEKQEEVKEIEEVKVAEEIKEEEQVKIKEELIEKVEVKEKEKAKEKEEFQEKVELKEKEEAKEKEEIKFKEVKEKEDLEEKEEIKEKEEAKEIEEVKVQDEMKVKDKVEVKVQEEVKVKEEVKVQEELKDQEEVQEQEKAKKKEEAKEQEEAKEKEEAKKKEELKEKEEVQEEAKEKEEVKVKEKEELKEKESKEKDEIKVKEKLRTKVETKEKLREKEEFKEKEEAKEEVKAKEEIKEELTGKEEIKEKEEVKEKEKVKDKVEIKEELKEIGDIKEKEEAKEKEEVKVKEEIKEKDELEEKEKSQVKEKEDIKEKEELKKKGETKDKVKEKDELKEDEKLQDKIELVESGDTVVLKEKEEPKELQEIQEKEEAKIIEEAKAKEEVTKEKEEKTESKDIDKKIQLEKFEEKKEKEEKVEKVPSPVPTEAITLEKTDVKKIKEPGRKEDLELEEKLEVHKEQEEAIKEGLKKDTEEIKPIPADKVEEDIKEDIQKEAKPEEKEIFLEKDAIDLKEKPELLKALDDVQDKVKEIICEISEKVEETITDSLKSKEMPSDKLIPSDAEQKKLPITIEEKPKEKKEDQISAEELETVMELQEKEIFSAEKEKVIAEKKEEKSIDKEDKTLDDRVETKEIKPVSPGPEAEEDNLKTKDDKLEGRVSALKDIEPDVKEIKADEKDTKEVEEETKPKEDIGMDEKEIKTGEKDTKLDDKDVKPKEDEKPIESETNLADADKKADEKDLKTTEETKEIISKIEDVKEESIKEGITTEEKPIDKDLKMADEIAMPKDEDLIPSSDKEPKEKIKETVKKDEEIKIEEKEVKPSEKEMKVLVEDKIIAEKAEEIEPVDKIMAKDEITKSEEDKEKEEKEKLESVELDDKVPSPKKEKPDEKAKQPPDEGTKTEDKIIELKQKDGKEDDTAKAEKEKADLVEKPDEKDLKLEGDITEHVVKDVKAESEAAKPKEEALQIEDKGEKPIDKETGPPEEEKEMKPTEKESKEELLTEKDQPLSESDEGLIKDIEKESKINGKVEEKPLEIVKEPTLLVKSATEEVKVEKALKEPEEVTEVHRLKNGDITDVKPKETEFLKKEDEIKAKQETEADKMVVNGKMKATDEGIPKVDKDKIKPKLDEQKKELLGESVELKSEDSPKVDLTKIETTLEEESKEKSDTEIQEKALAKEQKIEKVASTDIKTEEMKDSVKPKESKDETMEELEKTKLKEIEKEEKKEKDITQEISKEDAITPQLIEEKTVKEEGLKSLAKEIPSEIEKVEEGAQKLQEQIDVISKKDVKESTDIFKEDKTILSKMDSAKAMKEPTKTGTVIDSIIGKTKDVVSSLFHKTESEVTMAVKDEKSTVVIESEPKDAIKKKTQELSEEKITKAEDSVLYSESKTITDKLEEKLEHEEEKVSVSFKPSGTVETSKIAEEVLSKTELKRESVDKAFETEAEKTAKSGELSQSALEKKVEEIVTEHKAEEETKVTEVTKTDTYFEKDHEDDVLKEKVETKLVKEEISKTTSDFSDKLVTVNGSAKSKDKIEPDFSKDSEIIKSMEQKEKMVLGKEVLEMQATDIKTYIDEEIREEELKSKKDDVKITDILTTAEKIVSSMNGSSKTDEKEQVDDKKISSPLPISELTNGSHKDFKQTSELEKKEAQITEIKSQQELSTEPEKISKSPEPKSGEEKPPKSPELPKTDAESTTRSIAEDIDKRIKDGEEESKTHKLSKALAETGEKVNGVIESTEEVIEDICEKSGDAVCSVISKVETLSDTLMKTDSDEKLVKTEDESKDKIDITKTLKEESEIAKEIQKETEIDQKESIIASVSKKVSEGISKISDTLLGSDRTSDASKKEDSIEESVSHIQKPIDEAGIKALTSSFLQSEVQKWDDAADVKGVSKSEIIEQGAEIVEDIIDKGAELAKERKDSVLQETKISEPSASDMSKEKEKVLMKSEGEAVLLSSTLTSLKKDLSRSGTPGSDPVSEKEYDLGRATPQSDISSGQVSRAVTHVWESSEGQPESRHYDSDEDVPGSPLSTTSHVPSPPQFEYDLPKGKEAMTSSFYGSLPSEPSDIDTSKPIASDMFASMYVSKYGALDDDQVLDETEILTKDDKGGPYDSGFSGDKELDTDFETAVKEHTALRGSTLTSSLTEVKKALSETSEKVLSKPETSQAQPTKDVKKDPIEKWDKPLGLPPPPKIGAKQYTIWNPFKEWGSPLGLPSPAPPPPREDSHTDIEVDTSGSNKTTPKKISKMNADNKLALNNTVGKDANNKTKRSDSPVKKIQNKDSRKSGVNPIYMDLSYVPHHGNSHYANVEFFKKVRARYYVFSGTEPSKEVFNALLEAKQTWEDKDLEVTIIPTYDTDTLGYWIAENEETLSKYKIDLSPSASRCTINLQDHDTSCSAYRLEF